MLSIRANLIANQNGVLVNGQVLPRPPKNAVERINKMQAIEKNMDQRSEEESEGSPYKDDSETGLKF